MFGLRATPPVFGNQGLPPPRFPRVIGFAGVFFGPPVLRRRRCSLVSAQRVGPFCMTIMAPGGWNLSGLDCVGWIGRIDDTDTKNRYPQSQRRAPDKQAKAVNLGQSSGVRKRERSARESHGRHGMVPLTKPIAVVTTGRPQGWRRRFPMVALAREFLGGPGRVQRFLLILPGHARPY